MFNFFNNVCLFCLLGQRLKERDEEYNKLLQEKKDLEKQINLHNRQNADFPVAPYISSPTQTHDKVS